MAESTSSLRSGGRLLIAEFDSPAQARSFDDRDPAVALRELTQRLRVGMIVAESVVVTDAMVLDGAYFLALGPSGVLRDLGLSTVQLPLLITGRAISLAQALEDRRADPEHLWASAGFVPSRRWYPPESVLRVWDEWIDAEERGLLRYEQQEISSSTVMRFGDLPTLSVSGTAFAARLRRTAKRSVAENMLRLSVLTHEERAVLRDWWSDAYMRLIAENARADWLSFRGSHASRPEERQGAVMLALPERLKTWAEMATPAAVAEARGCTTALRKRLVEHPRQSSVRSLAYVAMAQAPRPRRRNVVIASSVRVLVAAILIVFALPFLPWLASDGPFAWIVFAIVAATTIPYGAMRDIALLMVREPHAVLVLHRENSAATEGGQR